MATHPRQSRSMTSGEGDAMEDGSVPDNVFVIMRSTGEYSDRDEVPIRYCLSEEDAKAAVALAAIEAVRGDPRPEYRQNSAYGYQMPSGEWLPEGTPWELLPQGAKLTRYPNADESEAQYERLQQEYDAACLALGHVDPEGGKDYATYSYVEVSRWKR